MPETVQSKQDMIEGWEQKINELSNVANYVAGKIDGQIECLLSVDGDLQPETVKSCYAKLKEDFNKYSKQASDVLDNMFMMMVSCVKSEQTAGQAYEELLRSFGELEAKYKEAIKPVKAPTRK